MRYALWCVGRMGGECGAAGVSDGTALASTLTPNATYLTQFISFGWFCIFLFYVVCPQVPPFCLVIIVWPFCDLCVV